MKILNVSLVVYLAIMCVDLAGSQELPNDEEIRQLLVDRIDVQQKSVGMVVGIITPHGRRLITYGRLNQGDTRPLDGNTVFEIGSVTKIFTALLLADMVQHGEVQLDDPVAKHLPSTVHIHVRNGRPVTLVDLATQTSGLPFFPAGIPLDDRAVDAVAKYTPRQLYDFLSTWSPTRDSGSKWEYSNTGFGLLGLALAQRGGVTYESLIHDRIIKPIGLESTALTLSANMKSRLAVGHDAKLRPAPTVNMPAFEAAGSLRSTANDLLSFLACFLGFKESPLVSAMASMLATRRPGPSFQQALGWWIVALKDGDPGFVFHGGQTSGFSSSVGFDPETHVGVVVLSNGTEDDGGLAWHLLRPAFPMSTSSAEKARKERKEISLQPELANLYAGQYQVKEGASAGMVLGIERQGAALALVSPTTPPGGLRLHAENEERFFITEADLLVEFHRNREGQVESLAIQFAGVRTMASKIRPGTDQH
jgi:CubicO group peptidase (beta-lactamase class C family)